MSNVTLTLKRDDVGQILEGLRERAKQWEITAAHWRNEADDKELEEYGILESSSEEEAAYIASRYRFIIRQIESQL